MTAAGAVPGLVASRPSFHAAPPEAALADPVGTALRLRADVGGRIAEALASMAVPVPDVYVGWVAAQDAARCPARYRAQGQQGWRFPGWSPVLAAAACGRAALVHHLALADLAGRPPAPPVPHDAIRAWMRAQRSDTAAGGLLPAAPSGVGDWVADTWRSGDTITLAAVAATAGRWLAGFVRVLGWPLPPQLTILNAAGPAAGASPAWRPRATPAVAVGGSADARLGRVTGSGRWALVVHRVTTGDDAGLLGRAAFESAAGALAIGVAPAAVVVTAGDTGERAQVIVDDDLLARGAERIVAVVAQRARAVERGFDPADATPSSACRGCDHLADCPAGQGWLSTAGRWRGGLPVR